MKIMLVRLTWTNVEMVIGSTDIGNRRMLNKDKATNAVWASNTFLGSERTKLAKLATAT